MPNDTPAAAPAAAPAAPAAAPAAPAVAPAAPSAEAPWHGLTDPDAVAYIQNKGWQGPADVVKSYMGAEKLIGRSPDQLLVIPRADDPDGMKAVFQKLGLPDSPDKYDMKAGLPQDAKIDDNFAKAMQGVLHEANLTESQAKTLVGKYNTMLTEMQAQQARDYELNVAADKQALADEWKGGHDRMMAKAKSAAQTLGFTPEAIDAIEKHMGYANTYKFFAGLGAKLGEDGLVMGAGKTPGFDGMLTPAEAKAEWDKMRSDPNIVSALSDPSHPRNKEYAARQKSLFSVMYPER